MVVRWWMALQELDFEIKFIAGSENSIADALSRLCINNKIGTPKNIVTNIIWPLRRHRQMPQHSSWTFRRRQNSKETKINLIKMARYANGRMDIHPELPMLPEDEPNKATN